MGKIIETKITRFDGGVTNDPRDTAENRSRMVANFDILTDPRRMLPKYDSVDGDSSSTTNNIVNFCIGLGPSSAYKVYGLGATAAGGGLVKVFYKNLTTGSTFDLSTATWTTTANNTSASGTFNPRVFVYYANQGLIYGVKGLNRIWAYDPTGVAVFNEQADPGGFSYTNVAQGVVHSENDILYIPYDNKIARKNQGAAFELNIGPSILASHYITAISEYGSYLAIATAPLSGFGKSRVYLWDMISTTATEIIDWDYGVIRVLEEIDGRLIGITVVGANAATLKTTINFSYYNANGATLIKQIVNESSSTSFAVSTYGSKQKVNNRVYFSMIVQLNGSVRDGVWSFGPNRVGEYTLALENTTNNDTALITSDTINSFIIIQDYVLNSYLSATNYTMSMTNRNATFVTTAYYESRKFNDGDSSINKKLLGVTITTDYLPSAGTVAIKYKKDEETSFTTIFTNSTDNSISHSAVNIESTGVTLPIYKEIEFRIESYGGSAITGLKWRSEVVNNDIY